VPNEREVKIKKKQSTILGYYAQLFQRLWASCHTLMGEWFYWVL